MKTNKQIKQFAMSVDTRRCVGCHACVLACKAENRLPEKGFRDWITTTTTGNFPHLRQEIRSERCHHCSHSPCVSNCPTGASHKGPGGTVLVDKNKCTGCKACIAACPYDARYVHPEGYVDKCTFCSHRIEKGLSPACVSSCPTRALDFGDLGSPNKMVATMKKRKVKVLQAERGLEPNLFFLM